MPNAKSEKVLPPRLCRCGCNLWFTPSNWRQQFTPLCMRQRLRDRWKAKNAQHKVAPRVVRQPKPLNQNFAPDFSRAFKEMRRELERSMSYGPRIAVGDLD